MLEREITREAPLSLVAVLVPFISLLLVNVATAAITLKRHAALRAALNKLESAKHETEKARQS